MGLRAGWAPQESLLVPLFRFFWTQPPLFSLDREFAFLREAAQQGNYEFILFAMTSPSDRMPHRSATARQPASGPIPAVQVASDREAAATQTPVNMHRILTHLGLAAQPPPRAPAVRVDLFEAA